MNIVYINHYAGSVYHGMEYRPYYMAREWVRLGHDVTIIAASVSHLRQNNPVIHGNIEEEVLDGIRYLWCRTPSYDGNGVGRVVNIFLFLWRLFSSELESKITKTPDLVIASSTYPRTSIRSPPGEEIRRKTRVRSSRPMATFSDRVRRHVAPKSIHRTVAAR